jgi:hypothetical protein
MRRIYNLLLLVEILSLSLSLSASHPFHQWCCLVWDSCIDFCLNAVFIDGSGILRSPTIIISVPICHFMYCNVCFIKLMALMFSSYISITNLVLLVPCIVVVLFSVLLILVHIFISPLLLVLTLVSPYFYEFEMQH